MSFKTKRRIVESLAWLAFLLMLAVVDGMDHFVISAGRGGVLIGGLVAVWAFGLWKAGWIRLG